METPTVAQAYYGLGTRIDGGQVARNSAVRPEEATYAHDPESLPVELDRLHISYSTSGLGSYRMSARTDLLDPIGRERMFQQVR